MTITTRDQLISALANNSSRLVIDKASMPNTAIGQFHSLWRATGQPGQAAIPAAAAVCAHGLLGSFNFTQQVAPATSYLAYLDAVSGNSATTLEIHDRLMHMGGLSGIVTTAQTVNADLAANLGVNNLAERIGDANYSDVQWWLEWYADTGATGVTATVNVTYGDGTSSNIPVVLAGSRRSSFMQPLNGLIPAADSGKFIRDVNTVTLSATTGTAGGFGVTATRKRASLSLPVGNVQWSADWAGLPIGEVPNDSCLFALLIVGSTSTGTLRGSGKIAHG